MYDPYIAAPTVHLHIPCRSSAQEPLTQFSGPARRPNKARDVPSPTQRKRVKASNWEQTGPAEGGTVDPELIPSYWGHVAGSILRGQAWIYMYFPMFTPAVRPGTQSCRPYIQQYSMLGYKTEHKLLDIRLRLDMMSAEEARRPANNRIYIVRNLFVKALWLEVPSHLLTETWSSVPAIPPSACTNDYMQWFLPQSHPQLQNSVNIPRGFHVLVDPSMLVRALLDLVAREARERMPRKLKAAGILLASVAAKNKERKMK
ncbi:hypothetical protein M9H77_09262 [Catharanthus roseus]|uniref:Uncharacterized protein n=1 Tax=Catharanthus roseus TaxID=4058 RepID=A0ACC0C0F7_CATRO|nr:hypothetical protein M9H77_09262 [Catharanthus roseus]